MRMLYFQMTQKKRNEMVLGSMMRSLGYYVHKWGDVRYGHCPKCNTFFPLPKAEKKPDFLIALQYRFIEAKGAGNSWHFDGDFRPNQREFMDANEDLSWIFVEIGEGKAPKGKKAFLLPWKNWKIIEDKLLKENMKSIIFESTEKSRVFTVDSVFDISYCLVWENGLWNIPQEHIWWKKEI